MHESLADTVQFGAPRIMSGTVVREKRVHATVPVAYPDARFPAIFILDVKAPACRARIGTGTAVDTGK